MNGYYLELKEESGAEIRTWTNRRRDGAEVGSSPRTMHRGEKTSGFMSAPGAKFGVLKDLDWTSVLPACCFHGDEMTGIWSA